MSADAPIVVRNVNHHYGKGALRKQILFDITTEIPRGEIVIVTGPSGSGKTTMLTLVGALRSAQEAAWSPRPGAVRGRQRGARTRAKAHRLHLPAHNLLGALTAAQNVELGLRVTAS